MTNIDLAYRVGTTSNRIATNEMRLNEERIRLEKENKFLKERISKAIEYIENEMPCLWEVDDVWEDIEGNYQHNYKEYDTQILLNKLKGVDKE